MDSFRAFVRKHLSKSSLSILFVSGLGLLALSGQAFYINVDSLFTDISQESTLSMHGAVVNSYSYKHRLPSTPSPTTTVPFRNLSKGSSGEDVIKLQNFLKWRGFWPKDETTTGYFGDKTKERVMEYQKWHKINAEGEVGPKTLEAWQIDLDKAKE